MWFLNSGMTLERALINILASLLVLFVMIPLHEFSHGYIAYKFGDNTAKINGRLTLNPIVHVSSLGAVWLILFNFGWGNPVPVNYRNFKKPRLAMISVALAGLASNIIAAFLGAVAYNTLFLMSNSISHNVFEMLSMFFGAFIVINVKIAVFNLIPFSYLDGSKILESVLPSKILYKWYKHERILTLVIFILLLSGVLSMPLHVIQSTMIRWVFFTASFIK